MRCASAASRAIQVGVLAGSRRHLSGELVSPKSVTIDSSGIVYVGELSGFARYALVFGTATGALLGLLVLARLRRD